MGRIVKNKLSEDICTVYINDFDDDYHLYEDEKEFTEIEKAARRLKKRYRNLAEYNEALITYYTYLIHLNKKYGGTPEYFTLLMESGVVTEFIPSFPQIKKTKLNKTLMKKGIVLTKSNGARFDMDTINQFIDDLNIDYSTQYEWTDETYFISDKMVKKASKKWDDVEKKSASSSVNRRSKANMSEVDFLQEYFESKQIMERRKKRKNIVEDDELSFADILYGNYDEVDEVQESTTVWFEGNLVNRDELDDIKLLRMMKMKGWNPMKIVAGRGLTAEEDEKGSKKEMEGVDPEIYAILKRHDKLEKKRKKKRKKNDNFLAKVMSDNNYDTYDEFEEDMLSATGPYSAYDGRFD